MEDVMALTDKELQQNTEDIIDIEIAPIKRKRFRLNGDNSKIIELNTSDLSIADRLEKGWAALQKIAEKISNVNVEDENFTKVLQEYNQEMKDQIDYIFDAEVADKAADGGTMYDPYNGVLRYEHILDTLLHLYETNITKEFNAMKRRVNKHTEKYTGAKKSTPSRRTTKK